MLIALLCKRPAVLLSTLAMIATPSLSGCAALARPRAVAPAQGPSRPTGATSAAELFLIGDYQSRHGDAAAVDTFKEALRIDPSSPDLLTALATAYRREGQLELAKVAARDALKHAPDQPEALGLLYELHAHSQEYDQALPYLVRLYELDREDTQRLAQLAQLYLETDRINDAIALLEGYLKDHPASVIAHFHLGRAYGAAEQFDKAAEHFRRCTEERPDVERGFVNLGAALEQTGDLDGAIDAYQHALDLNPYNTALEKRIAQLLVTAKKGEEAIAAYERLIAENPQDLHSQLRLALLLFEQEDFDRALDRLQRIHQRWPDNPRATFFLGLAYEQTERFADAAPLFRELYEVEPTNLEVAHHLINSLEELGDATSLMALFAQGQLAAEPMSADLFAYLGTALVRMEKYAEGEEVFTAGIKLYPDDARLYFQLGAVFEKMKRYPEAFDALEHSIRLDPEQAHALNYLGYMYAEQNIHLDESLDLLTRAVKIRPDDGYVVDSLGWVHYKRGELDEARASLEKAVELVPNDAIIRDHLGDVYWALGRNEDAFGQWNRALELDGNSVPGLAEKVAQRHQEHGQAPGQP